MGGVIFRRGIALRRDARSTDPANSGTDETMQDTKHRDPHDPIPARRAAVLRAGVLSLVALLAACAASAPPPAPVEPVVDIEQRALVTEAATELRGPVRVVFDWSAREVGGGRLSGAGVTRAEPPYRARLDLFLDNNEAVAQAALVGGDLRLPSGAREELLPPPHLLWGTLGVFRPGVDQTLLGGDVSDGTLRIRYRLADASEIHYEVRAGRVFGVERLLGGSVVQRVELEYGDDERIPARAVYRDLAEGRELVITRTTLEHVEPFPPDIWGP